MTVDELLESRGSAVAVGVVALAIGYLEQAFVVDYYVAATTAFFVVLLVAVAAGVVRQVPSVALAATWVLALTHLLTGTPVMFTELVVVAFVAFGVARWGSGTTATAAGASIPVVLGLAVALVALGVVSRYDRSGIRDDLLHEGVFGGRGDFGALVLSLAVLGLPFLAGLALRSQAAADDSRRTAEVAETGRAEAQVEADQAQEIARLRAEQARLARDVHDVVGHSLAVILAQAESAQYLPDDAAQLKTTLQTIATSARSSLQDVRHVLASTTSSTTATPAPPQPTGLEDLVAGVRASGQEVVVHEEGRAQPLPPELEVVAHRVTQEMLTNAVKHGARDQPITVERHWPAGGFERDLRIEVRNAVAPPEKTQDETQPITALADPLPDPAPGQGLEGMQRRVESVGGRLDVRRRVEAGQPTFTATAWVPVSRT